MISTQIAWKGMAMQGFIRFVSIFLLGLAVYGDVQAQVSNSSVFIKAVRERDVQKANELLSEPGAAIIDVRDPDTGEAALHIAMKRRDLGWLGLLMNNKANPNLADRDGNTALILAASQGYVDGAKLMIAVKSDINASNRSGETALIKAVQNRFEPMVRLLLASGAKVTIADNVAGLTALDYALQDRRASAIVKLLREAENSTAKAKDAPQ